MELVVFQRISGGKIPPPETGEVLLKPAAPELLEKSGLASLVLEQGLEALQKGAEPIHRIIIDVAFTRPSLDDLLAACFVERRLKGLPLPAGCAAFARYAGLVRKGYQPGKVPVEVALESIYRAIRNASRGEPDLTEREIGARFKQDWSRMEEVILKAAEQGVDPFQTPLFAEGAEFAEERARLLRDRDVYLQDVNRGEKWLVRLPPGKAEAAGLLLNQPASLGFPAWSRTDKEAPCGGSYLFLAVDFGKGRWVFSTDPAQAVDIGNLQEQLQAGETAWDPTRAARDPWVVRFAGTQVAAPNDGTVLPDWKVRRIVKKWARARTYPPVSLRQWLAGSVAALLLLAVLTWVFLRPPPPAPAAEQRVVRINGQPAPPSAVLEKLNPRTRQPEAVILKAFSPQRDPNAPPVEIPMSYTGSYDADHSAQVAVTIRALDGRDLAAEMIAVFACGTQPVPGAGPARGQVLRFGPTNVQLARGGGTLAVEFKPEFGDDRQIQVEATFPANRCLHILAAGVSNYPDPSKRLPSARKGAEELVRWFEAQQKSEDRFFHQVNAERLYDERATRQNILDGLAQLKRKATPFDLAILILQGHGERDGSGHFAFLPYDASPLSAYDLFTNNLLGMPCEVLVLADTCHSGALTEAIPLKSDRGLMVIAASSGDQKANEREDWGYGALTLAVLEGLQGKYLYEKEKATTRLPAGVVEERDEYISLKDLDYYVTRRVRALVPNEYHQHVVTNYSPDFAPDQVAIFPRRPVPPRP